MVFLIFIHIFKIETLRRFSKTHAEESIDLGHHFFFLRLWVASLSDSLAKCGRTLTELGIQQPIHISRITALVCLLHGALWNNSVFFHQIDKHIPLSAVTYTLGKNVTDNPVIHRTIR